MAKIYGQSHCQIIKFVMGVLFIPNTTLVFNTQGHGFRYLTRRLKCEFVFYKPVAGNRNNSTAALTNVGSNGNYWSSTVDGTNARNLNFNNSNAAWNSNNRANGFSVRCLKEKMSCCFFKQI